MLAIQIAALTVKHGNFLQRSSLQHIYNDFAFIDILATGGYLPITFVLYALRTVGYKSGYLLSLSGCTIVVSAAALLSGESIPGPVGGSSTYTECGNMSPIAFCYGSNVQDSDFGAGRILTSGPGLWYQTPPWRLSVQPLVYSLLIFILLLVDYASLKSLGKSSKVWTYMSQDEWVLMEEPWMKNIRTKFNHFTASPQFSRSRTIEIQPSENPVATRHIRKHSTRRHHPEVNIKMKRGLELVQSLWWAAFGSPRKFRSRVLELFNLTILGLFIYFMAVYMKVLTIFKGSAYQVGYINLVGIPLDLSNWTFGQLVAITVWVPPLMQYVYLELCKSF